MSIQQYILESPSSCGTVGTHRYVGCSRFFVFFMSNKCSATLPSSVIIQPLVLFNAIKIELYQ